MAYVELTDPVVGESTKASWAQGVNANMEDHEARLSYTETIGLSNGSFEVLDGVGDPVGWTIDTFSGGSYEVQDKDTQSAATYRHGSRALALTATALGGYATATSDTYLPCAEGIPISIQMLVKCTVATIPMRVDIDWFDEDGGSSGTNTTVWSSEASNPTDWTFRASGPIYPPTGTHYFRVIIYGGKASNTVGGTVFYDGISASTYSGMEIPKDSSYTVSRSVAGNGTKTLSTGANGGPARVRLDGSGNVYTITDAKGWNDSSGAWDSALAHLLDTALSYPINVGTAQTVFDLIVNLDPLGRFQVVVGSTEGGETLETQIIHFTR